MTAKNPEVRLSRRKFLQIAALLAAVIASAPIAACTPPPPPPPDSTSDPETPPQPQRTIQEIFTDAVAGRQPTEQELARLLNELAGDNPTQLAGLIIHLVRLYPNINHQELLTHLNLQTLGLTEQISQLLELLVDQVDLFPDEFPFDHRLAYAEKMAKEKGTGLNEYLAEQLFLRIEPMINRFPSLANLIPPGGYTWDLCKQLQTIPQQIYPQVLMAFNYFTSWQKSAALSNKQGHTYSYVVDGFVDEILPLYFDGDVPKEHDAGYQGYYAQSQQQLLQALFPKVPEELSLIHNPKQLSNRNDVLSLFSSQLTDLCLYLLKKSTENPTIRNRLLPLIRAVQAEVSSERIISEQHLEKMLNNIQHNPQFEEQLRQAVGQAIVTIGVNAQADLEKQYKPITKPQLVIELGSSSDYFGDPTSIVIPEETLPKENDLYKCANLYLPVHSKNSDGSISSELTSTKEFVPLLSTEGQYFSNPGALENGLNFFRLTDNRIVAVPQQTVAVFLKHFSDAVPLKIKSLSYRKRGGLGAALENAEQKIAAAQIEIFKGKPENLANQLVIGTFAVCEQPPEEFYNQANPVKHPADSITWITITRADGQYYAHSPTFEPNKTYTAVYSAGKVEVQHTNLIGQLVTNTYKFLGNDPGPGFFDARMTPMAQALGEEFLAQMQSSTVTKQVFAFLKMAALTSKTGSLNNKNYMVYPKGSATVYCVTHGENKNDAQEVMGSTSDPLPIMAGNLTTYVNLATAEHDSRFCVVLGEIRAGGLGRGSKTMKLLVPKDEVDILEIPQSNHPLQHQTWSQLQVAALYGITEKVLNTGKIDIGAGLFLALQKAAELNSGIRSD